MSFKEETRRIIGDLKKAFRDMSNHILLSFAVAALDAFFIFSLGFLLGTFFKKTFNEITSLLGFFAGIQEGLPQEELLEIISSQAELYSLLGTLFVGATIFFVSLCIVWTLLQSFSWHLLYRISDHESGPKFVNYLRRFAKSNLLLGGTAYLALVLFIVMITIPIRSQMVGGSVFLINILSILSYLYIMAVFVIFAILLAVVYSSIFSKYSFRHYMKNISSLLLSKRFFIFLAHVVFGITGLWIADMAQKAFHVLPSDSMVIWIRPELVIGFILVFGTLIVYRLAILNTYERLTYKKR